MTLLALRCPVRTVKNVADNIFVLSMAAPRISSLVKSGQFVNIRIEDSTEPLLRRPFSVYRREGENIEILFNVIGRGTACLSHKVAGEELDVLGPLGVPFSLAGEEFRTALLVGGGLGVAPLPLATDALLDAGKDIQTFIGARSAGSLALSHLKNPHIATDDGSRGHHGTIVDLVRKTLTKERFKSPKIFGCGPTPMLRALAQLARQMDIPCEVSLEGPMGCGFGICQGCPVELVGQEKKYALMCKDGPVFDIRKIRF